MESDNSQTDMFSTRSRGGRGKKVMTAEHRKLIEMYNTTPTMVVNRAPKSTQKGASDTPLFMPRNQVDLF